MDEAPSKYITLVSRDGFEFVVLREAALVSPYIRKMLDPRSQFAEAKDARCVFQEMRVGCGAWTRNVGLTQDSGQVLDKVVEYFHYWYRFKGSDDIADMEIPVELCLQLLAAADYLQLDEDSVMINTQNSR